MQKRDITVCEEATFAPFFHSFFPIFSSGYVSDWLTCSKISCRFQFNSSQNSHVLFLLLTKFSY